MTHNEEDFTVANSDCVDSVKAIKTKLTSARTMMVRSYFELQGISCNVEDPSAKEEIDTLLKTLARIVTTLDKSKE